MKKKAIASVVCMGLLSLALVLVKLTPVGQAELTPIKPGTTPPLTVTEPRPLLPGALEPPPPTPVEIVKPAPVPVVLQFSPGQIAEGFGVPVNILQTFTPLPVTLPTPLGVSLKAPIEIKAPSIEPVAGTFFLDVAPDPCEFPQPDMVMFTVPAGKLLIIEDASARIVRRNLSEFSSELIFSIGVNLLGSNVIFHGELPAGGVETGLAGGRTMKVYAHPGSRVRLFLECLASLSGAVNIIASFSGQLVDFP